MALPFRKPYVPQKKKAEHLLNSEIRHPEVRITGDDIESRIVTNSEARRLAREMEMDLVEISSTATPPVCRICDYNKFLYDLKKKKKEQERKQVKVETKEMRLTYTTDDHDVDFKVRHATEWLKNGDKVKCVIRFHGRTIMFREKGEMLLLKISQMLQEVGRVEALPKLDGKLMIMIIAPKKK
jgi:translation initiation factor IF-3